MSVVVWIHGISPSPLWASITAGAFAVLLGSGLTWLFTSAIAKRQRNHEVRLASDARDQERKLAAYRAVLRYLTSVAKYMDHHTKTLRTDDAEPPVEDVGSDIEALANLVVSPLVLDQFRILISLGDEWDAERRTMESRATSANQNFSQAERQHVADCQVLSQTKLERLRDQITIDLDRLTDLMRTELGTESLPRVSLQRPGPNSVLEVGS